MATLFYKIAILLSMLVQKSFYIKPTVPAIGTDCLGNDFLCVDQKHFLICVERSNNRFETVDQTTQTCDSRSECNNNMKYECATIVPVNASVAPQTSIINESTTPLEALTTELPTSKIATKIENVGNTRQSQVIDTMEITLTDELISSVRIDLTTLSEVAPTLVSVFQKTSESALDSTIPEIGVTLSSVTSETLQYENPSSSTNPSTWPAGTTPMASALQFVCQSSGSYPHPTDCHKFTFCIQFDGYYRGFELDCVKLAYDPATKSCSTETARLCGKSIFRCTAVGYYIDPYSLVKYYMCVSLGNGNFRKLELSCPLDLVYDDNVKQCVKSFCGVGKLAENGS